MSWLIGSGVGVITAAIINITTMECLLYLRRNFGVSIPIFDSTKDTIGISKTIPVASIIIDKKLKYSLMSIMFLISELPKLAANASIPGIITKYEKNTPVKKQTDVKNVIERTHRRSFMYNPGAMNFQI